jgi:cytochrome c peroxidase
MNKWGGERLLMVGVLALLSVYPLVARQHRSAIGSEAAIQRHLLGREELKLPIADLIGFGRMLFTANWTEEDGAGRPLSKGTGKRLIQTDKPLTGMRAFNRVSGPDANSCAGCHNTPFAIPGGGGDFVTNAFILAERFDFVTFDRKDNVPTRGSLDEAKRPATLQTVGNLRSTPGLFGAGYIELLARQITRDLRRARDGMTPGTSKRLISKGISYGTLARRADGTWDTRKVEGLPPQSLVVASATEGPSLIIRPWHQSGSVVSLREFTNAAFNRHHGIQSTERFGVNTDPDGDGVKNELTRGDVTAVTVYQATLAVPGRVIPNDPDGERRIVRGEALFSKIGCATCHIPSLPLDRGPAMFAEPGAPHDARSVSQTAARVVNVDLNSSALPAPRLTAVGTPAIVQVPAYTDLKLHDITDAADPNAKEPLDMNQPAGSAKFFAGNRRFLTRRLWDVGSQPSHFHHGLFTTIREAVLAHAGEALEQRRTFERLAQSEQESILDFLRSLQALLPGTASRIVDEHYRPRAAPENPMF